MPSRFVIKQNQDKEFYFNFLNNEDDVLLISGEYADKDAVDAAIKDVKLNSLMSQQLAAGKTPDGAQFFVIKGSSGDIIVKSALFTSQMVMDNALHCVKDNACVADIEDMTLRVV